MILTFTPEQPTSDLVMKPYKVVIYQIIWQYTAFYVLQQHLVVQAGGNLPGQQTFLSTVAAIWTCPLEKTPTSFFTEPDWGH